MSLITIDQLLESVDLDFEPRFVTKDYNGDVYLYEHKPTKDEKHKQWYANHFKDGTAEYTGLKLAEFENKPWQDCIYEVPRKTTGKIEKLENRISKTRIAGEDYDISHAPTTEEIVEKINLLVDAVNELKERTEPKKLTGFAKTLSDLDILKPMSTYTNKGE